MVTKTSVKAGKSLSLLWVSHGTTECIAPSSFVGRSILASARRLQFLETSPWPRLATCLDGNGIRVKPNATEFVSDYGLPARSCIETVAVDAEGDLESAVADQAEACKPDIVVVCSKTHEVIGPAGIGRVGYSVLAGTERSVLLLRCGLDLFFEPGPIIVPLNTPKRVMMAAEMLQRLEFPSSTEILFAAFQEPSQGALDLAGRERDRDAGKAEMILWAKESAWAEVLNRATIGLQARGWRVETVSMDETLAGGLPGLVEATRASLVVMGDRPSKSGLACDALALELLTSRLECSALVVR